MDFVQIRFLRPFSIFLFAQLLSSAAIITVGPVGQYPTPCAAIVVAQSGDVVEIDAAGNYTGDVCAIYTNGLTIRGANGRPHIEAGGNNSQGKGIWVIVGNDTLIENIEMSGAAVPSHNGAAIRQEGRNLTIRNCYFHDNEEGILTGPDLSSAILIEYSEFARNGYGDGFTHNMYIGNIKQFTLQFSYSHDAIVGHLVKSRASENYILYNRLTDQTGSASYELDLPNGGLSYVIGNVIQQSATTQNSNVTAYLEEGTTFGNPSESLYIVNNTFVNSLGSGMFVYVDPRDTVPALLENNFFSGGGVVTNQASAVLTTNYVGTPAFVNSGTYDYHLKPGSPGIDAGSNPGTGSGLSLMPVYEYVHPACSELRNLIGVIDIGAFEYNGSGPLLGCAVNPVGPTLGTIGLSSTVTTGGNSTTGNAVTLTGTAGPEGATVALTSSDSHAVVPVSVLVPAGQSSANFTISTSSVSDRTTAIISASFGGHTVSAPIIIRPVAPALASVNLAATSIASGGTLEGNTVKLTAPAPAGRAAVALQSEAPAIVSVPAVVTVPTGAVSAPFSIKAGTVASSTSVGIRASYGGKTSQVFVSVQPRLLQ
jgi:hypothetical protein